MSIRIQHDSSAPNAAVELTILHPLPDYDLDEVEASIPRDVDPMLASQGFHDLLDEARGILAASLPGTNLEVTQLTGAICSQGGVHRPGLWLVLRETGAARDAQMSAAAKTHVATVAEELRARLLLA
jgi:hypothetical protein